MKRNTLLLLLIGVVYFAGYLIIDRWEKTLYFGDSNGYYMHVVSFFVNQDVGDYDKTITRLREVNPESPDPREDKFGVRLTERGRRYIKYTLGVGVMETPFFLLADLVARWSGGKYAADGWSLPYTFIVGLATICYVLLGFYLLMRVLDKYFSPRIKTLIVVTIAFATNLFFFSTYIAMAHGFLFFDYCLLLFLTDRFYEKPSAHGALGIGAAVGLIALTRVPEVISALIPVLWGIRSWADLKGRAGFFLKNIRLLALAAAGFLAVFSLQIAYWHYVSGQFIFNPYVGEGFDFKHPHILDGWFNFANGWLIYTPVMAFAVAGVFGLWRYAREALLATVAFVGLHVFIHYSYYAWTFFPGLGSRPMVETYAILAFSLGACFVFLSGKKALAWLPVAGIAFCTWLNFFQTWQMREGIIWSERGNRAFYRESFGTMTLSRNALIAFDSREKQPDTAGLIRVRALGEAGFEDSLSQEYTRQIRRSGNFSLLATKEFSGPELAGPFTDLRPGDWIRASVFAYVRPEDQIWHRDNCAKLVVEMAGPDGKHLKTRSILVSNQIGNPANSIWSTGDAGQWGEAVFFVKIPSRFQPGSTLKVYVWNPPTQKIYIDDFSVEHWRKR